MGVTYKLREEVVHFIISQRQSNPLFSCRQLAESASEKFGLHLSKSSVHDVLKESGIVTPRGRKPKDKFEIPQEKKKQIQQSLSRVSVTRLLPAPEKVDLLAEASPLVAQNLPVEKSQALVPVMGVVATDEAVETSPEYEGAGKIFLKAALWDLGIFSEEDIKETDWPYYLTYSKGINIVLKNQKSIFIDFPLPLERCIRETADGLINNVKPFIAGKVSDQELFKACMEAQDGCNIDTISIVGRNDDNIIKFDNIVETKRTYSLNNMDFVESNQNNASERARALFFSQSIDIEHFINKIQNLNGFDITNKHEFMVNLLAGNEIDINLLNRAAETLNGMYLYDDQDRLVKVKIHRL